MPQSEQPEKKGQSFYISDKLGTAFLERLQATFQEQVGSDTYTLALEETDKYDGFGKVHIEGVQDHQELYSLKSRLAKTMRSFENLYVYENDQDMTLSLQF